MFTYTEVAAQEIFADVGSDPLAMVATVHSFLWSAVSPFQRDIKRWAREQAGSRLAEREAKQRSFGSRAGNIQQAKVESDIEKLRQQIAKLDSVDRFRYGLGTDFGRGVIGHEDVLKVATRLLLDRPLLATLLSQRYPFVFIDESQDTFVEVVEALKQVRAIVGSRFCLGFFGDPMQKVYPRGVGAIHSDPDWAEIKKPENFRSPQRVLDLMNDIRSPVDGLRQVSGLSPEKLSDGKVFFFVVPADDSRTQSLRKVRQYLDTVTSQYEWTTDDPAVGCKILVIAHRMAARRLGFEELYSAFHDSGSSSLSQSFDDGTAWPVKFFCDSVLPLVRSTGGEQLAILRQRSPLLRRARSGALPVGDTLSILRADLEELVAMVNAGGP